MHHQKDRSQEDMHWLRRHWLLFTAVAVVAVLLMVGQPLLAADAQPRINQTVPPPTPRPTVENPNNDNNNDGSNNNDSNNNSGSTDTGATNQPADAAATTDVAQAAAVTSTTGLTATVNVLALNVRQGPGTTFPVVGKLTQGSAVGVEARNAAGDWLLVCCIPGTTTPGWVSASLVLPGFTTDQGATLPVSDSAVVADPLATAAPVAAATPVPGSQPGVVAGVNLNVRQGPRTGSPVVGKLTGNTSVSVLGRNAAGDWLYICCIGNPPANGWVSAQFITPAFAAADLEEVAAPEVSAAPAATPAPQATETSADAGAPAADSAADPAAAPAAAGGLSVSISQQPPFAVQGREVALVYTVRNNGSTDLSDVVLSSELPGPLTLVGATAAGAEVTQQAPSSVAITWPALAAGESATATVRVRVADDVPNGTTFANLATVSAGDESAANGITIGMPPALLPEFW